ncbi:hypothetical protein IAD21_05575 [Abditibacteriota bacterium]|nr:hypothetical protein IAD21_05575 [Abditibacteriota bacterium]
MNFEPPPLAGPHSRPVNPPTKRTFLLPVVEGCFCGFCALAFGFYSTTLLQTAYLQLFLRPNISFGYFISPQIHPWVNFLGGVVLALLLWLLS